jgi:small-conductance mechanosensitive channel-like protein
MIDFSLIISILLAIGIFIGVDFIFARIIRSHDNITNRLMRKIARISIIAITIVAVIDRFGILGDMTKTFLTNSALLVAVLGFLLQNTLKNILAGALLLSSETFKIGQRIRLPEKDISGIIEKINMRHTVIHLTTNERAIVPNYLLNEAIIVNNDLLDSTTVYPLVITIPLDKDLLAAKQIVRDVINDHDNVLDKDADIIVTTVTKDTVELKTLIKTRDLDTSFDTLSDLREQVLTNLRQLDYFNK